jgi:hypothetical protein
LHLGSVVVPIDATVSGCCILGVKIPTRPQQQRFMRSVHQRRARCVVVATNIVALKDTANIRLTIGERAVTARLIDSETARDFVSLLPLTLTMNDLVGREKFGHLPRTLSKGGKHVRTYEVGEVVYWSPGPDVAVFYRHDGSSIPSPGIVVLAKIGPHADALDMAGSLKVTIDLVE